MTEQTMNQAIEKLAENYNQLEQSLVNQLRLQVPNHQLTVGTYRERVWNCLLYTSSARLWSWLRVKTA